ncbi:DHA2 family efflux MFS transporter permease subunit [Clostridium drakei]|uniref:MFS transporter n=1 Tax=Clostridium drakei TaxID=332101 RepID=A0A2U8DQS2_9CLOT|nr:DHA2 family efflux MFS transporter permease subunit [Clostridium drakei]AWI04979.1 MFS transporter [Clostridium drakei]
MEQKESPSYKWLCLGIVIIGTFMAFLDTSIVNIAVTKIMSSFGSTLDRTQWVLTGYMLASGAVIPLTGYLEDTFGMKKVYVFSLIVFTVGSFMCGISWNINVLIFSRVVQAIGGGMIMPVSMSMVYKIMPKDKIGIATAIYGIAAMAAPAIGPTLGGYIVEYLTWNLIFTVNVPIGIMGTFLAIVIIKDSKGIKGQKLDYIGVLTSTLGLVSILYVIGEWSNIDWGEIKYPLLIIFGSANFILFVVQELTTDNPLLDLRILKIYKYTLSLIITSIIMFGIYGLLLLMPLFLQNLVGLSAVKTGIMMMAYAFGSALFMMISGKISSKIGSLPLIALGMILMSVSTYKLYFLNLDTSNSIFTLLVFLRGASVGMCIILIQNEGMNALPKELVGRGSSLQNTVKQVVGSLSITILTIFLQHRQNLHYYRLAEQFNSISPISSNFLNSAKEYIVGKGFDSINPQIGGLYLAYSYLGKEAYLHGIDDAFMLTLFIILATIPLVFLFKKNIKLNDNP